MRSFLLLITLVSCSTHNVRIISNEADKPRVAHEAFADKVMVTSQGGATTRAALKMFRKGGNIIDAFVAASFTIGVERPHSTGIGGGGFLLYFNKKQNQVYAFDFREIGPMLARGNMYLTKKGEAQPLLSQEGALAVANPGLVKGLYEIHRKFGRLPWSETLIPAITLARHGLPVYPQLAEALTYKKDLLFKDPEARNTFYTAKGEVPLLRTIIYQRNLALTLETIAQRGSDGFYKGKIANSIINTVQSKGGLLTHRDLRSYAVVERVPVQAEYKGLKIYSFPPPSSGGVHVIQILKMLEPYNLKALGPQTVQSIHLTANAMQRAFLDRAKFLGDPDFNPVPTEKLLGKKYLSEMSQAINTQNAIKDTDLKSLEFPYESSETTHFTIADKHGNMIASTQTINGWFGSGVMAQGTGIILNNEMDDFSQKVGAQNLFGAVGGAYNLAGPKKRPLSSMSPTILTKDDLPYMALGSPSGTRIITCVAQTILNSVEYEMPLYEAVASTRIHHQWKPNKLKIEAPFFEASVEEGLKNKGHDISHEKLGCSIQAIKREGKSWHGVSDPRGEGLALGDY